MYNSESRTKSSIKNIIYTVGGQLTKELLAFAVRTVFIKTLAAEYLGVNGLFTNILSFLSLAEMGVGSALVFSMYKPMAEHDEEELKMYMAVYRRVYTFIGILVLTIGFSLTPFLDFFMKERPNIPHLELIYVLYVLNTGATYFFSFKGSIFNADQRAYVVTANTTIFNAVQSIARIGILLLTRNFIAYLTISIAIVYIQNLVIARKADKAYPFLKDKNVKKLSREELITIKKNIGALLMHKIGSVVLNSSDNLIISKYVSVVSVGLYSNYSLLINAIKTTFDMLMDSITTSVGNLCAKESKEKMLKVHNAILLLNIWIASFCVICLYNLLNPFIKLWIGEQYLFSHTTILAVLISFYIQITMRTSEIFKSALGLFWNDRYAPVGQCILNVVVSVLLVQRMEIVGIFVGTSVAMLLTKWWITPYIIYKNKFQINVINYFKKYFLFSAVGVIGFIVSVFFVSLIEDGTIFAFICKMMISAIVPNIVYIVLLRKTIEFRDCFRLIFKKENAITKLLKL